MPLFGPPNVNKMEAKHDVSGLIKALSYQKDDLIRGNAAFSLGVLKEPRAVESLLSALREDTEFVRERAADALGEIGDPRAIDPLAAALSEKKIGLRGAKALDKLGWKPGKNDASIQYHIVLHNWAELIAMGIPAHEQLIAALIATIDPYQEWYWFTDFPVFKYLGELRDERTVEPLITTLSFSKPFVRQLAARALGEIGDRRAVEPLITKLKDQESEVVKEAVEALVKIGDTRAVEPLIDKLFKSSDQFVIDALVKLGASSIETLIAGLSTKKENVRYGIIIILGRIGDRRAVDSLLLMLKDISEEIRSQAASALEKIGWQPTQDEYGAYYWAARKEWGNCQALGAVAVEPLIRSLKEIEKEDKSMRKNVAEMLIQLYKESQLIEIKKLIFDHRTEIVIPHGDYGGFEVCGRSWPHQDVAGLDFPL